MAFRINHIHLKAPDPRKTAEWYVRAFNFKIMSDETRVFGDRFIRCQSEDGGMGVNISGARTGERLGPGDASAHHGLEHFGFDSTHLETDIKRLEGLGARLRPTDTPEMHCDTRRADGPDDELVSDTAAVDARINRDDFILISHSHFNHCLDMPHIARKTGATVIGTESTTLLARAGGVPEAQLLTVRGGEDYEFGALSIKVIPSLHSALNGKHYYDGRVVPRDFSGPRRMTNDVEGGTLAYLIRVAGRRILWFGSMNYIEREVAGLRPDVALIAAARQRREIHAYTGRLMRALARPRAAL